MANSEKISDIIDDKAFEQLDRLLRNLGIAQSEFVKTAQAVEQMNNNLGNVKNLKELEGQISKIEAASKKMQDASQKSANTATQAAKAEQDLTQATKGRLLGIQEENKLLNSLSGTLDQNIRNQIRLKAELSAVRAEQKELGKQTGTTANQVAELATREIELKAAIQQSNLDIKRAVKETQAAEGSYDELDAKLTRLRATYKGLNEEEKNNIEIGGNMLASINEYDAKLREMDKSMGVTNRNVGNYSESIQDAAQKSGLFSREIAYLTKAKAGLQLGLKGATAATRTFSGALTATGIGALILILGSLISFLTTTQRGMEMLSRATDAVSTFVGVFIDALSKLGEQLIDSIVPALKGFRDILRGIASLDFAKMKQGFQDISTAVSSIEPIYLANVAKEARNAAIEAARLRGKLQELDKEEANLAVTRKQQESQLQRLRELSQDENASIAERMEASKQVLELENQMEAENLILKQKRLKLTREQNALTKSTEADLQRERDLEMEIAGIEAETARRRRRYTREAQSLQKQASAEQKRILEEREAQERAAALAAIELEESRVGRAVERTKAVAEDEKMSLDDRLSNLEQYLDRQEELIRLEAEKQLSQKGLLEDQITKIEEETQARVQALKIEGANISQKILEDQLKEEDKIRLESQKRILSNIERERDEELTALNNKFSEGLISEEEYSRQRIEIQRQFTREYVEQEIKAVEELMEVNRARGIDVTEQEKQLASLRLTLSKETADREIEDLKRVQKEEERLADLRSQLRTEAANAGIAIISGQYEREINLLQERSDQIDINKKKELDRIRESVASEEEKANRIRIIEAKANADKEANARQARAIQERQARFEKSANIAGIIGNTALAIVKQLALTPLPVGLPFVATIGAIGAAQLAQAIATPIPRFEKGTSSSPEGFAWVGEKGHEGRINPDGSFSLTPEKPTLTYLQKGTKIIPNHEMKQAAFSRSISDIGWSQSGTGKMDTDKIVSAYAKGIKDLKKSMGNKSQSSTLITKGGIHYIYRKAKNRKEYLSKNLS